MSDIISGRFVKQEQWERWRAKWKLVSGSNRSSTGSTCAYHPWKMFEILYFISSVFWAFLSTLAMGTAFPHVPAVEMTTGQQKDTLTAVKRRTIRFYGHLDY